MHPVIFSGESFNVYSYGLMIAIGIVGAVLYMSNIGKKEVGLTFDQANFLFLLLFTASVAGGKAFLFLEDPGFYSSNPGKLFGGAGFVFYGSFLFTVPVMLAFFSYHKLDKWKMLDIMAVTTCIVHFFGRIGCFLAGCCYGKETDFFLGVVFSDPQCYARPLNTLLHPSQLYEAGFILMLTGYLHWKRKSKRYDGQLFLSYIMIYAAGRFVLEYFRGDVGRGFIIENVLSHSQLIAIGISAVAFAIHINRRRGLIQTSTGN